MSDNARIPWDELSDSARKCVIGLVRRLADGYSGEVTIIAHEGGVRDLHEKLQPDAHDFEQYP